MIGSKFTEHGPANSGKGLPSSDKQQPAKTALRDLQNDNRILVPKSTGKPPLVKDRGLLTGEALVSGIKRPATECLQKPKSNQAPTSSGTNGPLVYARRKCEQELPSKSNEFSKDRKTDCAQEDQQEKEKPQQQAPSESTKKSCISAISTTSPIVTVLPKSNEFEKDKKCAQEDQQEKDKPRQQAQSESTKKSYVSAISTTAPMVTLPPKSNEFEKEKNSDCAQKDQQEQGKPQQQAQSESTKRSYVSAISTTSPMVTLPPEGNEFEKEKNIDSAQKDKQEQGKLPQQAQSESTKKSCVSAISATSPVVTSGGSSSFLAKPLNDNLSEQNYGTNTSEVSHSGKSEGLSDQQWKERFLQLQAHLRNCDQSRNLETIKKLQTLTPVGRSKYAVELEKRAIQLLLEEGNELMRMKELNVLGKAVAKNSAPPSTKQLQTEN